MPHPSNVISFAQARAKKADTRRRFARLELAYENFENLLEALAQSKTPPPSTHVLIQSLHTTHAGRIKRTLVRIALTRDPELVQALKSWTPSHNHDPEVYLFHKFAVSMLHPCFGTESSTEKIAA